MPGSKTYTSNKINELLEMEFLDGVSKMEKHSAKKWSSTFFLEVLKISLSLLISVMVECFSLKEGLTATEQIVEPTNNPIAKMEMIIFMVSVFVLSYLLIHLLVVVGKWLFSAIFNKRILPSERVKAYVDFHKKIINHIYLGISFENKYNAYKSLENEQKEIVVDLAVNYLSQAVHYFKLAKDELSELIPTEVKRGSYLDKRNAKYLDHIGYPAICIALISGQRSLRRLLDTKNDMLCDTNNNTTEANGQSTKQDYKNSLESLFNEINVYADCYQAFLERVTNLQKMIKSAKIYTKISK